MSKKKGTTKTADKINVTPAADEPEPWINELKTLTINDEKWSCNVTMIVEENYSVVSYLSAFNNIFTTERNIRPCIKVLSENSLAVDMMDKIHNSDIHKLSNAYKKLSEEALKYYDSFEFSKDMPVPIIASLIKYHIYRIKEKSIAESQIIEAYKQKTEKKRNESLLVIQTIVNGSAVSKEKSNEKKTPGKPTPTKKSAKDNVIKKDTVDKITNLRKRGEEILNYFETPSDAPNDGPQVYIILNSFLRESLPLELLKLEIPLISLIKLYTFCHSDESSIIDEEENADICEGLDKVSNETTLRKRQFSVVSKGSISKTLQINSFWRNFNKILHNSENVPQFKNTIFMKFYPKHLKKFKDIDEKSKSPDTYKKIQNSLYNQICHLQYDVQDVKRQHAHYNNHLVVRDLVANVTFDSQQMTLYTSTVESLPPQIINVPFILHCMLIQVEYLVDHIASETTEMGVVSDAGVNESERVKTSEDKLEELLVELDDRHDLFSKEEWNVVGEEQLPIVLVHGDELGIKTHWWSDSSHLKDITINMLQCFWEVLLFSSLPVYDEVISLDELQDVDLFMMLQKHGEVTVRDRLCNLPCINKVDTFVVEDKAQLFCLNASETSIGENSNSDFAERCRCGDLHPDRYKHYDDPKKKDVLVNIYDEHSYCFEEMTTDIMLQKLFDSLENSNCVDVLQDYFKDRQFIKFHHKKTCIKEEYVFGTLKTKTSIRDFYDYTIEEEFYFLNEQEVIYDRIEYKKEVSRLATALGKLEYLKNKMEFLTSKVCEDSNFIVDNSLKRQGQPKEEFPAVTSYTEEERKFSELLFEPAKQMESFDIDLPYRVQFSEKRQEFIISDNSSLRIKLLSRLYKDDAIAIQSTINGHTLYFYQPINNAICSDFHLIHKSGIVFHIKKNKIENASLLNSINRTSATRLSSKLLDLKEYVEPLDIFFKPLMYQLCLTLPNTLHLEYINPNDSFLYVKQHYLCNKFIPLEIQNEISRCFLTDGKLIKFLDDEVVVIYCHNGEIYRCEVSNTPTATPKPTIINEKDVVNKGKGTNQKNSNKTEQILDTPLPQLKSMGVIIESYEHILATGERILVRDNERRQLEHLFVKTHTDIFNGVLVSERSDGTTITYNRNGCMFVDFPDGSRISTLASIDVNEFSFYTGEELDEIVEVGVVNLDESRVRNAPFNSGQRAQSQEQIEYDEEGAFEDESYGNYGYTSKSEGFVLINIWHVFEHVNYATFTSDLNKEEINIELPCNVNITLSSEGLYNIRLDKLSQLITDYDKLIFREINEKMLPEFIIYLTENESPIRETGTPNKDKITNGSLDLKNNNVMSNVTDNKHINETNNEVESKRLFYIFSCEDDNENILTVNNEGCTEMNILDGTSTICKCDSVNNERLFVFNTKYNGLEIFSPKRMEIIEEESKLLKNGVLQNYGTLDHNTMLLLIPLDQSEKDKWLKPMRKVIECPLFTSPSTYNDENDMYGYNPFPKVRNKMWRIDERLINPNVLMVRVINRVNCNMHLQEEEFLENKKTPDVLRLNKDTRLALDLYRRGDIPFNKADNAFIEFVRNTIIGSLIARVRSHVVHRLEMRKIKEYTEILIKKLLLPYFDSAQGATFIILLDLLLTTVQIAEERHKLEKLFYKPLEQLKSDDLDYMHDTIAPLTVKRFCNCDENEAFCQLRILLLAGRTLHYIFPDMLTVFFSYGNTLKKKKEIIRLTENWKTLLYKPAEELTEIELNVLHDQLATKATVPFCNCQTNRKQCKLVAILLACVLLSFIFPDVNSVLEALKIEINL